MNNIQNSSYILADRNHFLMLHVKIKRERREGQENQTLTKRFDEPFTVPGRPGGMEDPGYRQFTFRLPHSRALAVLPDAGWQYI